MVRWVKAQGEAGHGHHEHTDEEEKVCLGQKVIMLHKLYIKLGRYHGVRL